jgi:hypothetical protein
MRELEIGAEIVEEAGWDLPTRERGLWSDAFRALKRNRFAIAAAVILLILAAVAVSTSFTLTFMRGLLGPTSSAPTTSAVTTGAGCSRGSRYLWK